jgi:hypothetical protein
MAVPTTRQEFRDYCLRKLGYPVIEVNVDDDQIEDRIDEALKFYYDYHFDGSEKIYYRHQIQEYNLQGRVSEVDVLNGGTGYSNTDTVVFTPVGTVGSGATATLTTNANGTITSINMTAYGTGYQPAPNVTITTSTGSGASFKAYNGGYITLPENIMGAVNIFPIGDPAVRADDLFNIRYQIALNDLYTLTSVSMIPYYMVMQHLGLVTDFLVGKQPIRYNRHTNKLYVDADSGSLKIGTFLLVEAYEVINPEIFSDAWGDRWLQHYCSQLIKRQWGTNLTKFTGMVLPGGVQFNGEKIYNDAQAEIDKLEQEMINSYSLPVMDMIG